MISQRCSESEKERWDRGNCHVPSRFLILFFSLLLGSLSWVPLPSPCCYASCCTLQFYLWLCSLATRRERGSGDRCNSGRAGDRGRLTWIHLGGGRARSAGGSRYSFSSLTVFPSRCSFSSLTLFLLRSVLGAANGGAASDLAFERRGAASGVRPSSPFPAESPLSPPSLTLCCMNQFVDELICDVLNPSV